MPNDTAGAVEKTPAIGVSLSVELVPGCTLVFQTHVDQTDRAQLKDMVDLLTAQADRAAAKYQIESLERQLEQQKKQQERVQNALADLHSDAQKQFVAGGRKGEFKLSSKDEQQERNLKNTLSGFGEEVAAIERHLAVRKAKIEAG